MTSYTSAGTENLMRWNRTSRGFMEVWYATVTDVASQTGLWVRYTILSPGDPGRPVECALWGAAFDRSGPVFAARTKYPEAALGPPSGRDDGSIVRIGDHWLTETHLDGAVDGGGSSMRWSLDLQPSPRALQHLPPPIGAIAERRVSTLCAPNPSTTFSGVVEVGGKRLELNDAVGTQAHRWGRRHAPEWAWVHCDAFDAGSVSLEGLVARAELGPLRGPALTFLHLVYEGEEIPFNAVGSFFRARSVRRFPRWEFEAVSGPWRARGKADSSADRFVQVTYDDPDGSKRYCANSEVADLVVTLQRRNDGGWGDVAELRATGTVHLEFGSTRPVAEVPIAY